MFLRPVTLGCWAGHLTSPHHSCHCQSGGCTALLVHELPLHRELSWLHSWHRANNLTIHSTVQYYISLTIKENTGNSWQQLPMRYKHLTLPTVSSDSSNIHIQVCRKPQAYITGEWIWKCADVNEQNLVIFPQQFANFLRMVV